MNLFIRWKGLVSTQWTWWWWWYRRWNFISIHDYMRAQKSILVHIKCWCRCCRACAAHRHCCFHYFLHFVQISRFMFRLHFNAYTRHTLNYSWLLSLNKNNNWKWLCLWNTHTKTTDSRKRALCVFLVALIVVVNMWVISRDFTLFPLNNSLTVRFSYEILVFHIFSLSLLHFSAYVWHKKSIVISCLYKISSWKWLFILLEFLKSVVYYECVFIQSPCSYMVEDVLVMCERLCYNSLENPVFNLCST